MQRGKTRTLAASMPRSEGINYAAEDSGGKDRLRIFMVGAEEGLNFHSLVWEKLKGGTWETYQSITRQQLANGPDCDRWIAEIHDFDATSGTAVIRVAERLRRSSGGVVVNYSWRRWDVGSNRELATLRQCAHPFEPYDQGP